MASSKVVIITGGSSGIGKSLAFEYGNHGYIVVITGRNAENLKTVENELIQNNIQAKGIKCDSANEEETKQMIKQVVSEFGGIDILINNAGISMRSMFESVQMDVMKQVMDINFWGTVYATHAALPYIKERKGGIIGISSIALLS